MTNKTLVALAIASALFTGHADASFTITNQGSQERKVDFDYTQNNNSQTIHLDIGPNAKVIWNAPSQGQACITALRVNDIPAGLYTLQNVPKYQPSCMQSADIHIWPTGYVSVEGVTVRSSQIAPR